MRDLYNRYIWLVDTIHRYGRISRRELDECWCRTSFGAGSKGIPRRTFHNYRLGAEEMFDINIKCDPATYEYYIEDGVGGSEMTDWLLNATATSEVLTASRDVADRIFVDDVPSARHHLAPIIEALRGHQLVRFDYRPYNRSTVSAGVVLEPYFLKIFRQRWYITGRHVAQDKIKTYALDRIVALTLLPDTFAMPSDFDAAEYTRHAFGIIFTDDAVHRVVLRADARQAKYLRTLPLHHSQQEIVNSGYSLFTYDLRITPDLIDEIMSYGSRLTVLEPPELRAAVVAELQRTLRNYE